MGRNSAAEIRAEIERQVRESAELDAELNRFMRNEVVPYAKSQYPVQSGKIAAQVQVTKPARGGKGQIGNRSPLAHIIEYGTGPDAKGDKSRRVSVDNSEFVTMGPNTPTPEFAPLAKTAKHFGGDMNRGISVDDSGD